jgi:hypothetical protein
MSPSDMAIFFPGEVESIERSPDRRQTRRAAERLAQLREGPIGLRVHQGSQSILLARERLLLEHPLRSRRDLAGFSSTVLQPIHLRAAHPKFRRDRFRVQPGIAVL